MPELLFSRILNGMLAGPVTALLNLFGHSPAHPEAPIPDHVAMQFLLVLALTILFLIIRSQLSVENPGGLQHVMEGAYNFVGNLGHEIIGHGYKRIPAILDGSGNLHPVREPDGAGCRARISDRKYGCAVRLRVGDLVLLPGDRAF